MPPIFTTKKIGIQGEQKKKGVKYYRNKKTRLRDAVNVKCGCETCRLGVYNCTYSHHCNSGPAPTAIQNKLFSSPPSLSFYPSFLLKLRGATITKRRSSDGLELG